MGASAGTRLCRGVDDRGGGHSPRCGTVGERQDSRVGAATMHGVKISGTFAVTSTSPGDKVEVLILDWGNYNALLVGGSWTAVHSSGQVTTGTLNVPVTTANPGGTTFYLAFVGISPEGPSVEVQANVDLKWTG